MTGVQTSSSYFTWPETDSHCQEVKTNVYQVDVQFDIKIYEYFAMCKILNHNAAAAKSLQLCPLFATP